MTYLSDKLKSDINDGLDTPGTTVKFGDGAPSPVEAEVNKR